MLELARPADREVINFLAREVQAMRISWRPDIYEMQEELYAQDRFLSSISERKLYTARIDSVVVGYVLLKICRYDGPGIVNRTVMLIEEMCVHESCRNQGIGQQMIAEVRALAKAFGCTDLQLSVYPQNDAAVTFYQKCGFTIHSINMQRKA